MIDISYIIKDPDFSQKFNVKRFKFLLEKGRFISQKVLDLSVKGVILPYMPLVRKHNEMLFETVNGSVTIYSQENLYGMALDEVKEESEAVFQFRLCCHGIRFSGSSGMCGSIKK